VLLAVSAVVLLALAGALDSYQYLTAYPARAGTNRMVRLEERFSEVSKVVPPGARLGYLSDVPVDQGGSALHGAAQYALAPHVLDTAATPPRKWILGDFYQPYDAARTARERSLEIVRDFGNGVVIFRRAGL
jgi:hypothetical protein